METAEIYFDLSNVSISGDATAEGYEGQIELRDWAWGMSLDEAPGTDATEAPQVKAGGISIHKNTDSSTTPMLRYLEDGKVIPKAAITLVHRADDSVVLRFEFENIILDSYDLEVDGSDDAAVELSDTWTFTYEKVTIRYKGRKQAGSVTDKSRVGSVDFTLDTSATSDSMQPVSLNEDPITRRKSGGALEDMTERELDARIEKLINDRLAQHEKQKHK